MERPFRPPKPKSDSGLGQFRVMLQSLITWQHFDDYYFVKLAKLNRQESEGLKRLMMRQA